MTMTTMPCRWLALALLATAWWGLAACDDEPADADADVDGDADSDADADSDGDGDPDADADQDADQDVDEELDVVPDLHCPGSEGCPDEGDGVLHVGAAAVDVTPTVDATTETQTVDVDGDGEYEPDDGDQFADLDGDGTFDGVWIAGFGNPRPASGVHDRQWARAIALRHNETTLVLLSLDVVGLFWDDVELIREEAADVDADHVVVASTHTHEARDTLGNWGPSLLASGVDLAAMEALRAQAAEAVREAVATLRPANVEYASYRLRDLPGGVVRYVGDNRDPQIVDDECRLLRFVEDGTESTIATLVNLAAHAEYTGDENQLLSSDFPGYLRDVIEDGVVGPDGAPVEGLGGVTVFFNGAVGSQIGPNDVEVTTWGGEVLGEEESLRLAETVGTQLGYHSLLALAGEGVVRDDTAAVGFRTHEFTLPVDNTAFQLAFAMNVFPTRHPEGAGEDMVVRTEVSVLDIGRATILTIPGELDPALFVGGYDGSFTPAGRELVDLTRTNPPDLEAAPGPPYLRDLARADAEYVLLFGLTNDELGYLIPSFDYELHPEQPYLEEAEGDHYEETNSLGPRTWPIIEARLEGLLAWSAE